MPHQPPIVPHIAYFHSRTRPFQLPTLERMEALYSTKTTIRGKREEINNPEGRASLEEQSLKIKEVYCLPDEDAWLELQHQYQQFDQALYSLAVKLDQLGSYSSVIAVASLKTLPARLSSTVIKAIEVDAEFSVNSLWLEDRWQIPEATRIEIERHTPKKLRYANGTLVNQTDHFICCNDQTWASFNTVYDRAAAIKAEWLKLLDRLGSYEQALKDKRYTPVPTAQCKYNSSRH